MTKHPQIERSQLFVQLASSILRGLGCLILSTCTTPITAQLCDTTADCPSGQVCSVGQCADPIPQADLNPGIECFTNEDCPNNARCVEGGCFQNECEDGEKRACETACGMGERLCAGGVWRACNAQPTSEICGTGIDEDCDQVIDEGCSGCEDGTERTCITDCGSGVERCIGGQFIGCTAARPRMEICLDPNMKVDEDCDGELDEECEACRTEGETRTCETACGTGVDVCSGGVYRDCNAPIPSEEICNNLDDDCDGNIDEQLVRRCDNRCGNGSERCEAGKWVECDAPENCACSPEEGLDSQLCEACGQRSRMCGNDQWGEWGDCISSGQCEPGESLSIACGLCGVKRRLCVSSCEWGDWQACLGEGQCQAGEMQSEDCPSGCGQRTRVCTDDCAWGDWSDCGGDRVVCTPNQEDTQSCGSCGEIKRRRCTDSCQWGAWGLCESDENACSPGESQDQSCGQCRTQTRVCNSSCSWGQWGECQAGSCTQGQVETASCGFCGQKTRTCTAQCGWGDWGPCSNSGVCSPGDEVTVQCGSTDVGMCEYGQQRNTCNTSCQWDNGRCLGSVTPSSEVCGSDQDTNCDGMLEDRPDGFEPNNSCASCRLVGMTDPRNFTLTASIDSYSDSVDYYCIDVVDDTYTLFAETISVSLTNIPNGKDYDLYLYQSIADCNNDDQAALSAGSTSSESLVWTETRGWDANDSGRFVIAVKPYSIRDYSCNSFYNLTINGLH